MIHTVHTLDLKEITHESLDTLAFSQGGILLANPFEFSQHLRHTLYQKFLFRKELQKPIALKMLQGFKLFMEYPHQALNRLAKGFQEA